MSIKADYQRPVGYLEINKNVSFTLYDKLPSRFHRWMAKVLLGWKYKEAKE